MMGASTKQKTRWQDEFEAFLDRVADKACDEFDEDPKLEPHELKRYLVRAFGDEAGVGMDSEAVVARIEECRAYAIAIGYEGVEAYEHALNHFAKFGMEGRS